MNKTGLFKNCKNPVSVATLHCKANKNGYFFLSTTWLFSNAYIESKKDFIPW